MKLMFLLALLAFTVCVSSQDCTACPSCDPKTNPDFPTVADQLGCAAKVVFILDESGSLRAFRDQVVDAAKQFWTGLSTLNGQGGSAQLGLIEFAAEARVVQPVLRPLDSAYVAELDAYVDSARGGVDGYSPSGTTDWGEALALANSVFTGDNTPDIIVFFTDGEPNGHDGVCEATCYSFDENNGDLGQACFQADQIKERGIKIFTVAVGDVIGNIPAIQVISGGSTTSVPFGAGTTAWDLQVSTFGTADYVVDAQVNNLGEKLTAVANALCRPPCENCAIFPTNNNPASMECVGPDAPTSLLDITYTSTGECAAEGEFGEVVVGFDVACREGSVDKFVRVADECDNESIRSESFTTFVTDTVPPVVVCPASVEQFGACPDTLQAITNLQVTGEDLCSSVFIDKSTVTSVIVDNEVTGYSVSFDVFDACNNHADQCVVTYGCADGADLQLVKTTNVEHCVVAGDAVGGLEYTITVTNLGPAISRDVVVSEKFPPGGMYEQRGDVSPSVGTISDLTLAGFTWSIGDLENGASASVTFRFVLEAGYPSGLIENYAIATSPTPDPELCNNEDTEVTRVCRESDLSVTKTDNTAWVTAGELDDGFPRVYAYEIEVTNHGPSEANDLRISDTFPSLAGLPAPFVLGARLQCDGGTCTPTETGFDCRIPSIVVGQTRVILATYTVPASTPAGSYVNTVIVTSDSKDPNTDNNQAHDETSVRTEANIGVSKTDEVEVVTAGDEITYTYVIAVWNAGPSFAREVRLVDTWPIGLTQAAESLIASQGECVILGGDSFSCNLGSLGVSDSDKTAHVRVSYTVPASLASCEIRNLVNIDSSTFDPTTCDNDAKDVNSVQERAQLSTVVSSTIGTLALGDVQEYEYEIVVTNNGPSTARQATLNDLWPVQFTQFRETLESTQGGCVTTGGDFSCAFGDIPVGHSVTVTVRFSVSELAEVGAVTNEVSAFSPTDTQCRSAAVEIQVVAEIEGKKRSAPAQIGLEIVTESAGEYTIVMTSALNYPLTIEDIVLNLDGGKHIALTSRAEKHKLQSNNCARIRGALLLERTLKCTIKLTAEDTAATIGKTSSVEVRAVSMQQTGKKLVVTSKDL